MKQKKLLHVEQHFHQIVRSPLPKSEDPELYLLDTSLQKVGGSLSLLGALGQVVRRSSYLSISGNVLFRCWASILGVGLVDDSPHLVPASVNRLDGFFT